MTPLDPLDRRIAASLLADGRASWRRIATALQEPERSVARRGRRLVDDGVVRVIAYPNPFMLGLEVFSLEVTTTPAQPATVADALAEHDEITTVSVLTANAVIGEAIVARGTIGDFLDHHVASIPGVTSYRAEPVAKYYRTASGWLPDALTAEEVAALGSPDEHADLVGADVGMDPSTLQLAAALRPDGRATAESIAQDLGVSKVTVGTWIERAISTGQLFIRGVVSPAALGYAVERKATISAPLALLDAVGEAVAALPITRVCALTGATLTCDLVARETADIYSVLGPALRPFPEARVELDALRVTLKRSGTRFVDDTPATAGLPF